MESLLRQFGNLSEDIFRGMLAFMVFVTVGKIITMEFRKIGMSMIRSKMPAPPKAFWRVVGQFVGYVGNVETKTKTEAERPIKTPVSK